MKFYTALDWRGFNSNLQFEEFLQETCSELMNLEIPKDARQLPRLSNAKEEIRHNLLLAEYRKFLNDTGAIYKNAMDSLKCTSFHFLVANGPSYFNTSDTPAFVHTLPNGSHIGILPITPRIILVQGKNTNTKNVYYISHITEEATQYYNSIIRENAKEFIILNW